MDSSFPHENLMVRIGKNADTNEKPAKNREQYPHRVLYMSSAVRDIVVDPRNQNIKVPYYAQSTITSSKAFSSSST